MSIDIENPGVHEADLRAALKDLVGYDVRGLTFTSDTGSTADTDPGASLFKWNHADQSVATALYFDNQTADGASLTTFWASLPPGGFITLQQASDPARWQLWKWTASPVDGTGYRKFTVVLQAMNAAIEDAELVLASFTSRSANAALDALALLTPAADKVPYFTSGTAAALADFPATARTLNAQTTQALMRSTGLGLNVLTAPLMNWNGYGFDGATDYLDSNALTGIADGKVGTFVWVGRFANAVSAIETIWDSTGGSASTGTFKVVRSATGNINVTGRKADGTIILLIGTSGEPAANAGTYVLMASWDLGLGTAQLYLQDVSNLAGGATLTDDTIDYTVAENSIGARVAGGAGTFFAGDMYVIWFDPTLMLDFSAVAVRRAFCDVNLVPVFMGRNGQLPTGTPPAVFHAYDPYTQWASNRGTLQATAWTEKGTPSAATTALYGQWAPFEALGVVKTVTADYTVGVTDRTIINNRAATNTLTLPAASSNKYRVLRVKTIQAQAVSSASSNVVPYAGGAAGTAILAATDGAWADLESDGVSWVITAASV